MPANIGRAEVRRLLEEEDGQLIEVLPRPEFDWAHLAGALHVPLRGLNADSVVELDRSRPVIPYCNDFQ
jgi:rhodanese-related sulfurtransferase